MFEFIKDIYNGIIDVDIEVNCMEYRPYFINVTSPSKYIFRQKFAAMCGKLV